MSGMKATLQEFIANVRTVGLPTTQHFYVVIPGFDKDELAYCNSTSLPGVDLMTSETRIYGEISTLPYAPMYGTQQLTFISDNTMGIRQKLEEWQNQAYDRKTRSVGYYDDYTKDVQIHVTDKAGNDIYCVTLYEAWIKSIGETQFDYSSEQLVLIPVTLVYKWWETTDVTSSGEVVEAPPIRPRSPIGQSFRQSQSERGEQQYNPAEEFINSGTGTQIGQDTVHMGVQPDIGGVGGVINSGIPAVFNTDTDVSQIDGQVTFSADENIKFKFPANPNSPEDIAHSIDGFADSIPPRFNRSANNLIVAASSSQMDQDIVSNIQIAQRGIQRSMHSYADGIRTLATNHGDANIAIGASLQSLQTQLNRYDSIVADLNAPAVFQQTITNLQGISSELDSAQQITELQTVGAELANLQNVMQSFNQIMKSAPGHTNFVNDQITNIAIDFGSVGNDTMSMAGFLSRTGLFQ